MEKETAKCTRTCTLPNKRSLASPKNPFSQRLFLHTYIHTYIHACMHACIRTYMHTYTGVPESPEELFFRNALTKPGHPTILIVHSDTPRKPEDFSKPLDRNSEPESPWQPDAVYDHYNKAGFHITELAMMRAVKYRDHETPFTFKEFQMDGKPGRSAWWHPSPLGHRFRGDVLAWNYLLLWENAAKSVLQKPIQLPLPLPPPLPEPLRCLPYMCSQNVKRCLTTYVPRSKTSGKSLLGTVRAGSKWKHILSPADAEAVTYNENTGLGYLDYKMILSGKQDDGWLSVDLPGKVSPVELGGKMMICGPATGWHHPEDEGVFTLHSEVRVNKLGGSPTGAGSRGIVLLSNFSELVLRTHTERPENTLCSKLTERGPQGDFRDLAGDAYSLHVRMRRDLNFTALGSTREKFYLALSHIIFW